MKKLIAFLSLLTLLSVSGCNNDKQEQQSPRDAQSSRHEGGGSMRR